MDVDEHPVLLHIHSLRNALIQFQDDAHASAVKLQHHSLKTDNAQHRTQTLEHQLSALTHELSILRPSHNISSSASSEIHINQLSLSLRTLNEKLDATESLLAERTHNLTHALTHLSKSKSTTDAAYELASRIRGREEALKSRQRELELQLRIADERARMSERTVGEYADLVRSLEGRSSSHANGAAIHSSDAIERLLTEFAQEREDLQSQISSLQHELALAQSHLSAQATTTELTSTQLAQVQSKLQLLERDDNTAAKMVSRYMKFSQQSTNTLQTTLQTLTTRHTATLSSLTTQSHSLTHTLHTLESLNTRLLTSLDSMGNDLLKESFGRRQEIKLRIKLITREERIVEHLRRWLRKSEERQTHIDLRECLNQMIQDAKIILEDLDHPAPVPIFQGREVPISGTLSRLVAVQATMDELLDQLQEERERRVALEDALARIQQDIYGQVHIEEQHPPDTLPNDGDIPPVAATNHDEKEVVNEVVVAKEITVSEEKESELGTESVPEDISPVIATNFDEMEDEVENVEKDDDGAVVVKDITVREDLETALELEPETQLEAATLSEDGDVPPVISDYIELEPPVAATNYGGETADEKALVNETEGEVVNEDEVRVARNVTVSEAGPELETEDTPAEDEDVPPVIADHVEPQPLVTPSSNDGTTNHDNETTDEKALAPGAEREVVNEDETKEAEIAENSDNEAVAVQDIQIQQPETKLEPETPPEVTRAEPLADNGDTPLDLDTDGPIELPPPPSPVIVPQLMLPLSSPPPTPSPHPLIHELQNTTRTRYTSIQRAFHDCHLALDSLKSSSRNASAPAPANAVVPQEVLKEIVQRLDDYLEDVRVELEIRVLDEEVLGRGYEALLSVPGALSVMDSPDARAETGEREGVESLAELEGQIRAFVDGTEPGVEKALRGFERKLEDLQHDVAVVKRAVYDPESEIQMLSAPPLEPSNTSGNGWASWIRNPSRPTTPTPTPAPTFGNVMTSRNAIRRTASALGLSDSSSSHRGGGDAVKALGLRIPMPDFTFALASRMRYHEQEEYERDLTGSGIGLGIGLGLGGGTPRSRTLSSTYMLGMGMGMGMGMGGGRSPGMSPLQRRVVSAAPRVSTAAESRSGGLGGEDEGEDVD
ncbi:hypothetical protein P691DRAFT_426898 [Macrolepiota fuliginosa MF-IS2]|uniref:Uncharacterized protein n=1 Tax=Macrolepiota fuliginosa MF-IS2 TaxID=1400762 RepID=A0A9P5X4S5_9AGAR|nr:hypothetical protein P691DRAFT_426898 [Macrolepiota fuliginosa MF-IS2]